MHQNGNIYFKCYFLPILFLDHINRHFCSSLGTAICCYFSVKKFTIWRSISNNYQKMLMWTQQKVHIDSPRKYLEPQEKKQPKTPLSFYVLLEVCNHLWKKLCLLKSLSRELQSKWAFLQLSASIICISFCHLAAISPVMGYICCCMLCAAFLLPLPLAYSESQANIHYSIPSLLLTWQFLAEWSHENQKRTPSNRQSMHPLLNQLGLL